jgi:hypothetical protein
MSQLKQEIATQIQAKQQIINQLPELVRSQILDQTTADLRAYTLKTEMADLKARLAQLPPVNLQATAQAVSIPRFWLDLTEAERRFYFREFIQQIQIIRCESRENCESRDSSERCDRDWQLRLVFIF